MRGTDNPLIRASRLLDRAYELVIDRFGEQADDGLVYKPDVFVRNERGVVSFGLVLEAWALSVPSSRVVFTVMGPTANSCAVRFRRRLQEVRA